MSSLLHKVHNHSPHHHCSASFRWTIEYTPDICDKEFGISSLTNTNTTAVGRCVGHTTIEALNREWNTVCLLLIYQISFETCLLLNVPLANGRIRVRVMYSFETWELEITVAHWMKDPTKNTPRWLLLRSLPFYFASGKEGWRWDFYSSVSNGGWWWVRRCDKQWFLFFLFLLLSLLLLFCFIFSKGLL